MHAYEIVIGGSENKVTSIRNLTLAYPVVTVTTPDILDCNSFQKFWVTWKDGIIQVGRGLVPERQPIIVWQDPNPYTIRGIAISTGFGTSGSWEFSQIEGQSTVYQPQNITFDDFILMLDDTFIMVSEPNLEVPPFRMYLPSRRYFEFSAESCDAGTVIGLYGTSAEEYDWEVLLGGETNDEISILHAKEGWVVAKTIYMEVMQCQKSTKYWIAWEEGMIQIGKGLYPHNVLLEGKNSAIEWISSMALLTWSKGLPEQDSTKWTFKRRIGMWYIFEYMYSQYEMKS
jgi:hypothetical protein